MQEDAAAAKQKKRSGEYMMDAPPVHPDEAFWLCVLAYQVYCGDYWLLAFVAVEPLIVHLLCRMISTPGDTVHTCNNIIPVDLRKAFNTPTEVIETIKGGEMFTETAADRPNSEWVRYFATSLMPDSLDHLGKDTKRLLCVLSQGGEYLPKASNATLAAVIYSVCVGCLTLSRFGWFGAGKALAISSAHINLMHILRDHSVSGLTHHGAHNVGELDKVEFIKKSLQTSIPLVLASFVVDWPLVHMVAAFNSVTLLSYTNHTLTHYNRLDIKGKGPGNGLLWKLVLDGQDALAKCKLITSKAYHAKHHFHNEMAYPAILMPINEFLNSKSLTPFLTRTMDEKGLKRVEMVINVFFVTMLYGALVWNP
jgi:hypothetical protein